MIERVQRHRQRLTGPAREVVDGAAVAHGVDGQGQDGGGTAGDHDVVGAALIGRAACERHDIPRQRARRAEALGERRPPRVLISADDRGACPHAELDD